MTAAPAGPLHLLTVAEYAELGETEHGYTELIERRLFTAPGLSPDHNNVMFELGTQLRPQVPDQFEVPLTTWWSR